MFKLEAVIAEIAALVPPKHIEAPPIPRAVWEAAVGTRIACRAEPVRLQKGVLQVRVTNAAWANELALLTCDILAELNRNGIDANALRFTVGQLLTPQPERKSPKPTPRQDVKLPKALEPCMEAVQDDALRAALTEAARKNLAIPK